MLIREVLVIAIHVFGSLAKVTDQAMTVAKERDWIVEMSKLAGYDDGTLMKDLDQSNVGNDLISTDSTSLGSSLKSDVSIDSTMIHKLKVSSWLSETNTSMKQIDLLCKVSAPAFAGIFFSFFDNASLLGNPKFLNLSYAALIICFGNLGSLYIEYTAASNIYKEIPTLARRLTKENMKIDVVEENELEGIDEIADEDNARTSFIPKELNAYFSQSIWPGGIAFALL